jgi:uncharacterized protein (TIGR02246 family)
MSGGVCLAPTCASSFGDFARSWRDAGMSGSGAGGRAVQTQSTADELEIQALAASYSDAVRRGDAEQAAATYAEDGVLMAFAGPEIVGRPAIAQALARVLSPMSFVMQTCAGGLIQVDGDRATARWPVTEWMNRRDTDEIRVMLGVYEDVVVRTPQGWRFARRRFHPFYAGDPGGGGKVHARPQWEQTFSRAPR